MDSESFCSGYICSRYKCNIHPYSSECTALDTTIQITHFVINTRISKCLYRFEYTSATPIVTCWIPDRFQTPLLYRSVLPDIELGHIWNEEFKYSFSIASYIKQAEWLNSKKQLKANPFETLPKYHTSLYLCSVVRYKGLCGSHHDWFRK